MNREKMTHTMRQKILVIQPLPGIGDALWFLPHLKALSEHYPKAELTLMTKPGSRADRVFEDTFPQLKVLWLRRETGEHAGFSGFFRLIRLLKEQHFEAVWILHKSPRYALAAKLAGIPQIYGYGLSYGALVTKRPHLTLSERTKHPIKRATALLHAHDVSTCSMDQMTLTIQGPSQQAISTRFHLDGTSKTVVLGVGGSADYKKWPAVFFADLAVALSTKGYGVHILGGFQEKREVELIQKLALEKAAKNTASHGAIVGVFDLSIQESFALLKAVDMFIGNDTGMLNAAAMAGTQTYGFFAKTPPLTYRPNLHAIVPKAEAGSVSDITVEDVLTSVPL